MYEVSKLQHTWEPRSIVPNTLTWPKPRIQGEQKIRTPRKRQIRSFNGINFSIMAHKCTKFQSSSTPGSSRATVESGENPRLASIDFNRVLPLFPGFWVWVGVYCQQWCVHGFGNWWFVACRCGSNWQLEGCIVVVSLNLGLILPETS